METDRIILRKWQKEDADVLVKNLNNEQMANDFGTDFPYTYKNACDYIEDAIQHNKEKYAIVYKENNEVIGGCGLHIVGKLVSGNMWIASEYHGGGIGTEASILLVEYCFKTLKMEKMENVFFDGNEASKKMQQKVGAVLSEDSDFVVLNGRTRIKKKAVITKENFEKVLVSLRGE